MQKFELHPQLKADTAKIMKLRLCQVLLMNDSRYPWVILVPAVPGVTEIHHLSEPDQQALMYEISKVSRVLEKEFVPKKLNIGALGCVVPQLHVHIICRNTDDPAWPGPVWSHSPAVPYEEDVLKALRRQLVGKLV